MYAFYQINKISQYLKNNNLESIISLDKFIFKDIPTDIIKPDGKLSLSYKDGENIVELNHHFIDDLRCDEISAFIDISEHDLDFFLSNADRMSLDFTTRKFVYQTANLDLIPSLDYKINTTLGGLPGIVADLSKTVELLLLYITDSLNPEEKLKINELVKSYDRDNLLVNLQYSNNFELFIEKFLERQKNIKVLVDTYYLKKEKL